MPQVTEDQDTEWPWFLSSSEASIANKPILLR
jgi:hypothetical protein